MSIIKRMIEDAYYELKDHDKEEVKKKYNLTDEEITAILTIMTDENGEPV